MRWSYAWQGINAHGKRLSGVSSEKLKTLKATLAKQNIYCLSIKLVFSNSKIKLNNALLMEFLEQLHALQQSGIPLNQSLILMAESGKNSTMITFCHYLSGKIQQGQSLSKSMMELDSNPIICQMIAVGEQSGTLIAMIKQAHEFLRNHASLKSTWIKAISYPAFVFIVAILITQFMLIFIVPKFTEFFADAKTQLPLLTRLVMNTSELLSQIGLGLFFGLLLLTFSILWLWRNKSRGALLLEKVLLKLPSVGKFIRFMQTARIMQILATTLKAGMPLDQALKISSKTSNWQLYQHALLQSEQQIRQGNTLAHALQKTTLFPKSIITRVAIGEQSGQLETMLFNIAHEQDQQMQKMIDYLSKWLEPVIMLIIGTVVGTIMIAMYLPILQVNTLF